MSPEMTGFKVINFLKMIGECFNMEKNNATIKVDTEENWAKAKNFVPDKFTIIVYSYENAAPKIKIGDGIHKLSDIPFLNNREVDGETLVL